MRARVGLGAALLGAAAYLGGWWTILLLRAEPDGLALAAAVVLTSGGVGRLVERGWALLLPALVVPVFAQPAAYTPGAPPDYSVGVFVAVIFVLAATPAVAIGVVARRSFAAVGLVGLALAATCLASAVFVEFPAMAAGGVLVLLGVAGSRWASGTARSWLWLGCGLAGVFASLVAFGVALG